MYILSMIFFFSLFLSIVMIFLAMFLMAKGFNDKNKLSPFECGFSPWENSRQTFSLQFFMVSLIFLIFDVELVILYPLLTIKMEMLSMLMINSLLLFILFMVGGLVLEWGNSKLDWFM